jgi:hypothetical protein
METFRGTIKIPTKSFSRRRKLNALRLSSGKDSVISWENRRGCGDNPNQGIHCNFGATST